MNKEQQELLDEAYKNYLKEQQKAYKIEYDKLSSNGLFEIDLDWQTLTQEEFINKIKTNSEFSKTWGLKIDERELSESERVKFYYKKHDKGRVSSKTTKFVLDNDNIPTRLITITYNNKTI